MLCASSQFHLSRDTVAGFKYDSELSDCCESMLTVSVIKVSVRTALSRLLSYSDMCWVSVNERLLSSLWLSSTGCTDCPGTAAAGTATVVGVDTAIVTGTDTGIGTCGCAGRGWTVRTMDSEYDSSSLVFDVFIEQCIPLLAVNIGLRTEGALHSRLTRGQ